MNLNTKSKGFHVPSSLPLWRLVEKLRSMRLHSTFVNYVILQSILIQFLRLSILYLIWCFKLSKVLVMFVLESPLHFIGAIKFNRNISFFIFYVEKILFM
jgi:hypothetical protein